MNEPQDHPLTLGEAIGVAEQIRQSTTNGNREYWAWTIDQLVERVKELERRQDGGQRADNAKHFPAGGGSRP